MALGLSVAWGVMTRLGGSLSARSQPGEGTIFTLGFPLATPRKARAGPGAPRHGRRILLNDDGADNLEALAEVLALEGQQVETARSGPEALARLERGERFDLALCDVGMPGMSGWQVAREIARLAPDMAVWMLPGWANEIDESCFKCRAGIARRCRAGRA